MTKRVDEDLSGPVECVPVREVEPPAAPKGWQGYTLQRLTPLLADAQAGQSAAREEIFFFLHARFLALAKLRLMGEDAEDVVQETMIVVERHFLEFQTVEELLAFTDGVMRNKIGSFYLKRKRRKRYQVDWEEAKAAEPGYYMDGQFEAAQLAQMAWDAIDQLGPTSESCRMMLLGLSEGMSLDELSEWLQIPRGRIDERLHRCRRRLRKILHQQFGLRL